MKRSQKGFTLIEIMLALLLVAIVASIAYKGFAGASDSTKGAEITSMVGNIKAGYIKRFHDSANCTGFDVSVAEEMGILADEYSTATDDVARDPYNHTVTMACVNTNQMSISFEGIAPKKCMEIAASINLASDAIYVSDAGVAVNTATDVVKNATNAYSATTANTRCNAFASVDIAAYFDK